MLPHTDDNPISIAELQVSIGIAATVSLDLSWPIPVTTARDVAMMRTPVPKTTVNEDRHSGWAEHYVGLAAKTWKGSRVDAVPQPESVQGLPEC